MSNIKIVADSSADLTELSGVSFAQASLQIVTDTKTYVDTGDLDVADMVNTLYKYSGKSSTSCPNIGDWLAAFGDAEEIFCLTITSGLSGSYNSAVAAKSKYEEEHPGRRVEVIDSLSAGPEIALIAQKIRDMITEGLDFDTIAKEIRGYKTELLFVLESMKNLANNGRVSKLAATVAGVLGIRAIGKASEVGTLEMITKCRGSSKAVDALAENMGTLGYRGGKVRICHCLNPELAEQLAAAIKAQFADAAIEIAECRGLCSFYAERGGMLIGFET